VKAVSACRRLMKKLSENGLRARPLIITVFGDALAPRGGEVWLGSLIELMACFGLSDRLVRTSVSRLSRDGWLQSSQRGRRAYYRLTESGGQRFAAATHRIYGLPERDWDAQWTLLLLGGLEADERELARREYGWLGFGALSAQVLAHPAPNESDLEATTARLGWTERLMVIRGRSIGSELSIRDATAAGWNLPDIDQRYANFLKDFDASARAVEGGVDARTAFMLRTLLVQEYRRILLRDPQLPESLLPSRWHGRDAYELCSQLYRALHVAADEYLSLVVETSAGPLPENDGAFFRRFGGLL